MSMGDHEEATLGRKKDSLERPLPGNGLPKET